MTENIYIPLIFFGVLLGATYYLLGIGALTSNIFMLAIYSIFVPILFFTYGAYIEKQIVKKQVVRVVENLTSSAEDLGYSIPDIEIPLNSSLDETVEKNNSDLLKTAFLYLSVGFIGGIVLSIGLWYYSKKKFNYAHMAYENLALLLLVAITELAFFGVVSRNYRSLDSNKLKRYILLELAKKLK